MIDCMACNLVKRCNGSRRVDELSGGGHAKISDIKAGLNFKHKQRKDQRQSLHFKSHRIQSNQLQHPISSIAHTLGSLGQPWGCSLLEKPRTRAEAADLKGAAHSLYGVKPP